MLVILSSDIMQVTYVCISFVNKNNTGVCCKVQSFHQFRGSYVYQTAGSHCNWRDRNCYVNTYRPFCNGCKCAIRPGVLKVCEFLGFCSGVVEVSVLRAHGALSLGDRLQMFEESTEVFSLKGSHLFSGHFEPSRRDHFALWQHWAPIAQWCCAISEKNGDLSNVSCKLYVLCACTQVMKSVHIGNWIIHKILNLKNMMIKNVVLNLKNQNCANCIDIYLHCKLYNERMKQ